jgi:hypothetical protein
MISRRKQSKPATAPKDGGLAIYDGQEFMGSVLEMGAAFVTYDAAGARIGTFKTLAEASRAIPPGVARAKAS